MRRGPMMLGYSASIMLAAAAFSVAPLPMEHHQGWEHRAPRRKKNNPKRATQSAAKKARKRNKRS